MAATLVSTAPPPPRAIWFGILAAPAAWAIQGLAAWLVESHFCGNSTPASTTVVPAGVRATEVMICIVAGVIAVAALLLAVRRWRDSRDAGVASIHSRSRPDFMAAAAMFVSVSFLVAIVLTGYATAMLNVCQSMR